MPKIFKPKPVEGYEWIVAADESDFEVFHSFSGRRASDWKPVHVERLVEEDASILSEADFPWLGAHALIVRERARRVVETVLGSAVELLPLSCDDAALWVVNPLLVIDALDESQSKIVRFSSGRIMDIPRLALVDSRIIDKQIFKLPELIRGATFLGERFVEAVRAAGLTGIDFDLVWRGE